MLMRVSSVAEPNEETRPDSAERVGEGGKTPAA